MFLVVTMLRGGRVGEQRFLLDMVWHIGKVSLLLRKYKKVFSSDMPKSRTIRDGFESLKCYEWRHADPRNKGWER